MQEIKMLKTMCGPDGNKLAGHNYKVDFETAKAWVSGPDPIAEVVDAPELKEEPKAEPPKPEPKREVKDKPKTKPKFVPGAK